MRPIATCRRSSVVSMCVGVPVLSAAKMAEPIEMRFAGMTCNWRTIFGVVLPIEKHWIESLLRCTQQKK